MPGTTGAAKRTPKARPEDTRYGLTSQFAALRSKLSQGVENAVIVVLGDSTGVGNGLAFTAKRWPYRLGEYIAAAYPSYTVRWKPWNSATPGYDAFVTIATGTGTGNAGGPFTIDIYNGSASGQAPAYSLSNLLGSNGLIPYGVMPDVILVNHSHNMGSSVDLTVNQAFYALIREALRWYNPAAGIVLIGQNPAIVVAGSGLTVFPQQHQQRQTRIAELCGTEGWGYLDINQAFLDTPNWSSQLLNADGLHPNDAGQTLWAQMVFAALQSFSGYSLPGLARPVWDTIVVPASAFVPTLILGGSPAAAVLNSFMPTMGFGKQAGVIGATANVFVPPSWRYVNFWVDWTTADGVAGSVAWQVDASFQQRIGADQNSVAGTVALTMGTGSTPTASAAATTAYAEAHTKTTSNLSLGYTSTTPQPPRRVFLRVGRSGANAGDTYAGTAHMLQLRVERAA